MTEINHAARDASRVAFVTCAALPDLDPDDQATVPLLSAAGVTVVPAVWDDRQVDWSGFDLTLLRSPWDYAHRRDAFITWAATVPKLVNPYEVVLWNTDKHYLSQLTDAGVPVVPTTWVAPSADWQLPPHGQWVIKPAVSAGSRDTGRYRLDDPTHRRLAAAHVQRLQRHNRTVMVQPYLTAVDTHGETALIYLYDPDVGELAFSHAITKGPMLTGPDTGGAGLYAPEQISARIPSAAQASLARQVLAAVPGGTAALLYARVDLVPGPDGRPVVIELELTEPSLFLAHDEGAAARFAAAIISKVALVNLPKQG